MANHLEAYCVDVSDYPESEFQRIDELLTKHSFSHTPTSDHKFRVFWELDTPVRVVLNLPENRCYPWPNNM